MEGGSKRAATLPWPRSRRSSSYLWSSCRTATTTRRGCALSDDSAFLNVERRRPKGLGEHRFIHDVPRQVTDEGTARPRGSASAVVGRLLGLPWGTLLSPLSLRGNADFALSCFAYSIIVYDGSPFYRELLNRRSCFLFGLLVAGLLVGGLFVLVLVLGARARSFCAGV